MAATLRRKRAARSSPTRNSWTAVAAIAAAGRTISFANGCFDVLHVGHVRYLEGARREGDRLIVAINDDESVRGLKGPGQPVLPAAARAELVAALRAVDYVVMFPDATVERLLRLRRSRTSTAKAPTTRSTPCPSAPSSANTAAGLPIVGDPKAHSTTRLLQRLRSEGPARKRGWLSPRRGCSSSGSDRSATWCTRCRPSPRSIARTRRQPSTGSSIACTRIFFRSCPSSRRSSRSNGRRSEAGWMRAESCARKSYEAAVDFQGLRQVGGPCASFRRQTGDGLRSQGTSRTRRGVALHRDGGGGRRPARHRQESGAGRVSGG